MDLAEQFDALGFQISRERLIAATDYVASETFRIDPVSPYTCLAAASEKYICRQLGYTGSFQQAGLNMAREAILICAHVGYVKPIMEVSLEGKDSFSLQDINTLESMLRRRLETEHTYIRNGRPKLLQIGHVSESVLQPYIDELRAKSTRLEDMTAPQGE
jgi:hypothetical protein